MALAVATLVLALDIGRCSVEALQIFHPFYTSGFERRFFNLLVDPENRKRPVYVNAPMLSFVAPIPSPFAADRYHRIFHFGVVHLRCFYDCRDMWIMADEQSALRSVSTCPDKSNLFYSSAVLARGPSWSAGPPPGQANFTQCAAVCRSRGVKLLEETENGLADSETVVLVRPEAGSNGLLMIRGEPCAASQLGELFPLLRIKTSGASYWLRRVGPDSYTVSGWPAPELIEGPLDATIRRFEFDRSVGISPAH
jgi:hypothetical protein